MKIARLMIGVLFLVAVGGCASRYASPSAAPTDGSSSAASEDVGAFCDAARELDKSALKADGHPNDSQLDRFVDTAPSEIKDDTEILAASAREFRSGNEEAASSDEIQAAADRFDTYVEENCEDV